MSTLMRRRGGVMFFGVACLGILISSGCGTGVESNPAVVNDDDRDTLGLIVDDYHLIAQADPDDPASYSFSVTTDGRTSLKDYTLTWDFGDGQLLVGETQEYQFGEPGRFEVTVSATDATGHVVLSLTREIEVEFAADAVIAEAGDPQIIEENAIVYLFAGDSLNPTGATLTYSWVQLDGPEVMILEDDQVTASFVAPLVDFTVDLSFELTVSDGTSSTSDSVVVTVEDLGGELGAVSAATAVLVANAGADQLVSSAQVVTLNGTRSTGPSGSNPTFRWTQRSGPTVALQNATRPSASFVAPLATSADVVLTFRLRVTAGSAVSTDNVTITVASTDPCAQDADGDGVDNCADGCPNDPLKTSPGACGCGVADTDSNQDGLADCLSPPPPPPPTPPALVAAAGADRTITAGSSTALGGSATGGTAPYSYRWSPTTGLSSSTVAAPTATPAATTTYTLTVTDAQALTATDSVLVTVTAQVPALVAAAGPDRTITAGSAVGLTGSATGGTTPYAYRWTPTTGLNNPNVSSPTAVPTATTTYTLTVTDAAARTASDAVLVTVQQAPPVISLNATTLNFGSTTASLPFQVWNSGGGTLQYTVAEVESWLTVSPASGSSTGEHDTITVTVSRGTLPDGVYTSEVNVNPPIGAGVVIFISMSVGAAGAPMSVATRTTGPAPLGVFFDASNTGSGVTLPPVRDGQPDHAAFRYQWTFGDANGQTWPVNGRSKNTATGHLAAHVFETPGSYRVALNVTDAAGTIRNYEQQITVDDPDVLFANTCPDCAERTFYVASTGDDTNIGSFNRPFRTWTRGKSRVFTGSGPRRLLLRRGDTFTTSTSGNGPTFTGPIMISAYGTGADPIISGQSASSLLPIGSGDNLTVAYLRFVSTYDPSTGYGLHPDAISMLGTNSRITVHRNSCSNIGIGIFVSQLGEFRDSVVSENSVTAWQNYGILTGEISRAAFLGNNVRQAANARTGDAKGPTPPEPDLPDHGPIRLRDVYKALVADNDLFSNNGWSQGAGSTPTAPIYAHQPCLRLGGAGSADLTIVADNVMEGGEGVTGAGPANDSLEAVIGRIIWERNKLIATSATRNFLGINLGGAVIRNNIFLQPVVGGQTRSVISAEVPPISSVLNRTALNRIHANTYVTLTAQEHSSFLEVNENSMANFEVLNNLVYVPGNSVPTSSFLNWRNSVAGPLGLVCDYNLYFSNSSVYATYLGTNLSLAAWRTARGDDTHSLTGDPLLTDVSNRDFRLRTGSPAINTGASVVTQFEDFAGSTRPSATRAPLGAQDIGAFESP